MFIKLPSVIKVSLTTPSTSGVTRKTLIRNVIKMINLWESIIFSQMIASSLNVLMIEKLGLSCLHDYTT